MVSVGDIYKTNNFGKCVVKEYKNSRDVDVEFIETGFRVKTTAGAIVRGQIKDKLAKTVCGVGFIGDGGAITQSDGVKTKAYSVWKSMIERCYSVHSKIHFPTYANCTVCDDWHNFQNFAKWYSDNHPKDGGKYEIDKDLSSYGDSGKIYSPETCVFVTRAVNTEESHAKSYKVRSPDGYILDIYNMSDYCRKNNLNISAMCGVGNGSRKYHKGYTTIVDKTNYRKEKAHGTN